MWDIKWLHITCFFFLQQWCDPDSLRLPKPDVLQYKVRVLSQRTAPCSYQLPNLTVPLLRHVALWKENAGCSTHERANARTEAREKIQQPVKNNRTSGRFTTTAASHHDMTFLMVDVRVWSFQLDRVYSEKPMYTATHSPMALATDTLLLNMISVATQRPK